jgi:hypothetical protein
LPRVWSLAHSRFVDLQSNRFENLGRDESNLTATPTPIIPLSTRITLAEYNIHVSSSMGSFTDMSNFAPSRRGFWRYAKAPVELKSRSIATCSKVEIWGSPTSNLVGQSNRYLRAVRRSFGQLFAFKGPNPSDITAPASSVGMHFMNFRDCESAWVYKVAAVSPDAPDWSTNLKRLILSLDQTLSYEFPQLARLSQRQPCSLRSCELIGQTGGRVELQVEGWLQLVQLFFQRLEQPD